MNKFLPVSIAASLLIMVTSAHSLSTISESAHWWSYVAQYEGVLGSTRVDMAQRESAPRADYPKLITAKLKPKTSARRPQKDDDKSLNAASDKAVASIMITVSAIYVGRFTFNGEQTSYVYVKETSGIQTAVAGGVAAACPTCEVNVEVKQDPEWRTYLKFLYPNPATLKYYDFKPEQARRYNE